MCITFDPHKRSVTLAERGLDFQDAAVVFEGPTVEFEDTRKDYGEPRIICFGFLVGRLVVVGYVPRGAVRHVFSMRKANECEHKKIPPLAWAVICSAWTRTASKRRSTTICPS